MVTAFDVKYGKPHPEPYLIALKKARVEPWQALVIENAPLGIRSSVQAGIFTVAVNTGVLEDKVLSDAGASVVFPNMEAVLNHWYKIYELIIIGSGAAGITAGIYAGRALIDTLVIEKLPVSGGQIVKTHEIDNYPGLPGISGIDLGQKLKEHVNQYELDHVNGEVTKFEVKGDIKEITLDNDRVYRAKAVLIATGADPRKLGIEGEEDLRGMGVSYCATCDGAFFRNMVAAIVGGGDTAVEDALFLSRICDKVYLIHRRDEFRAAKIYLEKVKTTPNIEIITDSVVEQIKGDDIVEQIQVRNVKTNEVYDLEIIVTGKDKEHCFIPYHDNTGEPPPELAEGMISIKWDKINKKWITANIKEEWYNYNNKEWVNVVLKNHLSGLKKENFIFIICILAHMSKEISIMLTL